MSTDSPFFSDHEATLIGLSWRLNRSEMSYLEEILDLLDKNGYGVSLQFNRTIIHGERGDDQFIIRIDRNDSHNFYNPEKSFILEKLDDRIPDREFYTIKGIMAEARQRTRILTPEQEVKEDFNAMFTPIDEEAIKDRIRREFSGGRTHVDMDALKGRIYDMVRHFLEDCFEQIDYWAQKRIMEHPEQAILLIALSRSQPEESFQTIAASCYRTDSLIELETAIKKKSHELAEEIMQNQDRSIHDGNSPV